MMRAKSKTPQIRFKGFGGEWKEQTLGKLAEIVRGASPRPIADPKWFDNTSDVGWLRIKDVSEQDGRIFHLEQRISKLGEEKTRVLTEPHLLLSIAASVGKPVINYVNTGVHDGFLIFKNPLFNQEFMFQWMKMFENKWQAYGQPGSQVNLNSDIVKNHNLLIPQEQEQIEIADYFQNLDKLIDQKEQKYQKLRQFKTAMLSKMFPQNGATTPEIRFKGFSGEWEEKMLGDVGKTYTGLSGKTKEDFGHGEGKYVTYMNVFSNPISKPNLTEPIEIDENQNAVKFGDVFFTTSSETPDEVGMTSVWMNEDDNIYLNSFCFGYRSEKVFDYYYLAYMLRSSAIRKRVTFLAQGISRYNISKNKVMEIFVPIPKIEEQTKIGNYFQKLDTLIDLHAQELDKLRHIKKASLEKMFV